MRTKIPFSFIPFRVLKKLSHVFYGLAKKIEPSFPSLKLNLQQAEIDATPQQYLSMCILSTVVFFFFISILLIIAFAFFGVKNFFLIALTVSIPITLFVLLQQIMYPRIRANRKIKNIERNLLPALQNIFIQLNSGVPLFNILVAISKEDYGEISKEFGKAVKEISAGKPQVTVLEDIAAKNPSLYFRRAIWQLVNGMKSGADISSVINEIILALSEEQLIQIQNYGGQLNPLAMFYMLIAVILPSLGMTFLIIISSFITAAEIVTKLIFWGLYGFVIFFQIMFLGLIKSRRPGLMGG